MEYKKVSRKAFGLEAENIFSYCSSYLQQIQYSTPEEAITEIIKTMPLKYQYYFIAFALETLLNNMAKIANQNFSENSR